MAIFRQARLWPTMAYWVAMYIGTYAFVSFRGDLATPPELLSISPRLSLAAVFASFASAGVLSWLFENFGGARPPRIFRVFRLLVGFLFNLTIMAFLAFWFVRLFVAKNPEVIRWSFKTWLIVLAISAALTAVSDEIPADSALERILSFAANALYGLLPAGWLVSLFSVSLSPRTAIGVMLVASAVSGCFGLTRHRDPEWDATTRIWPKASEMIGLALCLLFFWIPIMFTTSAR
jgi:hypothetical protein